MSLLPVRSYLFEASKFRNDSLATVILRQKLQINIIGFLWVVDRDRTVGKAYK